MASTTSTTSTTDNRLPTGAGAAAATAWRIVGPATHPGGRPERGTLMCHHTTGLYVLDVYGSIRSVPQAWARAHDAAASRDAR